MSSIVQRLRGLPPYSRRLWRKLSHTKARRRLFLLLERHPFNPMAIVDRWIRGRYRRLQQSRQPIRTDRGETLDCTEGEYNRRRLSRPGRWRTLCKAPWVSLDIRMDGSVSFCNHGG